MDTTHELTPIIEDVNDCICVHAIGHTMTFYREKGLPRATAVPMAITSLTPAKVAIAKVR